MLIRYIDINTNEIKSAKFFEKDYTLNQTTLVDSEGNHFTVGAWQLNLDNAK
jgi:hypothetical protein